MPLRDSHSINRNTNFPIKLSPFSYASIRKQLESKSLFPPPQKTFSDELPSKNDSPESGEIKSSDSEFEDDDGCWEDEKKPNWKNVIHPSFLIDGSCGESAVFKISGDPEIVKVMKKLMELQEQEDVQRFICRVVPSQRKPKKGHPHSDCCFANNVDRPPVSVGFKKGESRPNPLLRNKTNCGPFLSCSMKHAKSNDYEELPDFYVEPTVIKTAVFYAPDWLQRPPNTRTVNTQKPSSEWTKCRGCPQTSIFLSDPDLWIADYKYQVTYGRIPTLHKKRLKEKIEHWIPSDDYKERQSWLKSRMIALSKFHANQSKMTLRQQATSYIDKEISRRPINEPGPRYGPSAIAALSGSAQFNSSRISSTQHQNQEVEFEAGPQPQLTRNYQNFPFPVNADQQKDTHYVGDDIPWPSDNLRYYDDDTDPRVTELLVQAPFLVPGRVLKFPSPNPTSQKSTSKTSQGSSTGKSSPRVIGAKATGKQQLPISASRQPPPVEYVVGAGRAQVPQNSEVYTTMQTPNFDLKKPVAAAPAIKDAMGDNNKSRNTVASAAPSWNKAGTSKTANNAPSTSGTKNSTGNSVNGTVKSKNKILSVKNATISLQKLGEKNSAASSSSLKTSPRSTTPRTLHVKKRLSKPKTKRRFKKTITTVALGVPKSKDSKVSYDDDKY